MRARRCLLLAVLVLLGGCASAPSGSRMDASAGQGTAQARSPAPSSRAEVKQSNKLIWNFIEVPAVLFLL